MTLEIYLAGWLVAFGYHLSPADGDFRLYDLIVCPILWPVVLWFQVAAAIWRFAFTRAAARAK